MGKIARKLRREFFRTEEEECYNFVTFGTESGLSGEHKEFAFPNLPDTGSGG